jgi:predicted metal-binding protein
MASARTAEIVACETCGGRERDAEGRTRGEALIAILRRAQADEPRPEVSVTSTRCLWACQRSCAVHVRAPGRPGYVLVELAPDQVNAQALLDYGALYAASSDGAVPYRLWPQALRGHFLCRIPVVDVSPNPANEAP